MQGTPQTDLSRQRRRVNLDRSMLALEIEDNQRRLTTLRENAASHAQDPQLLAEISILAASIARQQQILEGRGADRRRRFDRVGIAMMSSYSMARQQRILASTSTERRHRFEMTSHYLTGLLRNTAASQVALQRAERIIMPQELVSRAAEYRRAFLSLGLGMAVGLAVGCAVTYSGAVYDLTDQGFGMTFGFPFLSTLIGGFCGALAFCCYQPRSVPLQIAVLSRHHALATAPRRRDAQLRAEVLCMLLSAVLGGVLGLAVGCAVAYSGVMGLAPETTFRFPIFTSLVGGFCGLLAFIACYRQPTSQAPVQMAFIRQHALPTVPQPTSQASAQMTVFRNHTLATLPQQLDFREFDITVV